MDEVQKKPDGGQAFPGPNPHADMGSLPYHFLGLSKREWYAGMATDGDVEWWRKKVNAERYIKHGNHASGKPKYPVCTREEARYHYADAMVAEGEKSDG